MKRTEYMFDFYHFGDDEVMAEHAKIVKALRELLPQAQVEAESCKTDHWFLTITVEADA
ncbi:MAG: hypothetical protein KDK24_10145 [Pseudooceanicola sp.]|nr:hypothetical protein [Pseudooceanicola sp.]